MVSTSVLSKALAMGFLAAGSPVLGSPLAAMGEIVERAGGLESRRDNCTQYTSVSAGSVCVDMPSDCSGTYIVQSGDTCQAIAEKFNNFTLTELYYWNPDISQTCLSLRAYVPVCVSTPWYTYTAPYQSAMGTVVPASAIPVPIMPGVVSNCSSFEFVGDGMTVDTICAERSISEAEFYQWNTAVGSDGGIWAEYWVCVGDE